MKPSLHDPRWSAPLTPTEVREYAENQLSSGHSAQDSYLVSSPDRTQTPWTTTLGGLSQFIDWPANYRLLAASEAGQPIDRVEHPIPGSIPEGEKLWLYDSVGHPGSDLISSYPPEWQLKTLVPNAPHPDFTHWLFSAEKPTCIPQYRRLRGDEIVRIGDEFFCKLDKVWKEYSPRSPKTRPASDSFWASKKWRRKLVPPAEANTTQPADQPADQSAELFRLRALVAQLGSEKCKLTGEIFDLHSRINALTGERDDLQDQLRIDRATHEASINNLKSRLEHDDATVRALRAKLDYAESQLREARQKPRVVLPDPEYVEQLIRRRLNHHYSDVFTAAPWLKAPEEKNLHDRIGAVETRLRAVENKVG